MLLLLLLAAGPEVGAEAPGLSPRWDRADRGPGAAAGVVGPARDFPGQRFRDATAKGRAGTKICDCPPPEPGEAAREARVCPGLCVAVASVWCRSVCCLSSPMVHRERPAASTHSAPGLCVGVLVLAPVQVLLVTGSRPV